MIFNYVYISNKGMIRVFRGRNVFSIRNTLCVYTWFAGYYERITIFCRGNIPEYLCINTFCFAFVSMGFLEEVRGTIERIHEKKNRHECDILPNSIRIWSCPHRLVRSPLLYYLSRVTFNTITAFFLILCVGKQLDLDHNILTRVH